MKEEQDINDMTEKFVPALKLNSYQLSKTLLEQPDFELQVEIISQFYDIYFYPIPGEGYIPAYTKTNFTDDLHVVFG